MSSHSLSVTWLPPPVEMQNGIIRYYIINILEEETMKQSVFNTANNSTLLPLDMLHPYYTYGINISAVTLGIGPFSIMKNIQMPETGVFCREIFAFDLVIMQL